MDNKSDKPLSSEITLDLTRLQQGCSWLHRQGSTLASSLLQPSELRFEGGQAHSATMDTLMKPLDWQKLSTSFASGMRVSLQHGQKQLPVAMEGSHCLQLSTSSLRQMWNGENPSVSVSYKAQFNLGVGSQPTPKD